MANNYANRASADVIVGAVKGGAAITASASDIETCRGFHANLSETIIVHFCEDPTATLTTLIVVAGQMYPYWIDRVTQGSGVVPLR